MSKFVTIAKSGKTKSVSYASYRNFFKDSGWSIVGDVDSPTTPIQEKVAVEVVEQPVVETTSDEVESDVNDEEDEIADEEWEEAIAEEEVEKPLSEMNRQELIAKAQSLGVPVKGNNSQLREAIKNAM